MKRLARLVAHFLLALVVLAVGVLGLAWWRSEVALARVHALAEVKLEVSGDPAQAERGRHRAVTPPSRGQGEFAIQSPNSPWPLVPLFFGSRPRERLQRLPAGASHARRRSALTTSTYWSRNAALSRPS